MRTRIPGTVPVADTRLGLQTRAQIAPTAMYHPICAVATWTAVEHATLTNMSFSSDELGVHTPFSRGAPLPTLRTLYIGQATLPASEKRRRDARAPGYTRSCLSASSTRIVSVWWRVSKARYLTPGLE